MGNGRFWSEYGKTQGCLHGTVGGADVAGRKLGGQQKFENILMRFAGSGYFFIFKNTNYSVYLLIIRLITMRITNTNDLLLTLNLLLAGIGVRGGGAF